MFRFLKFLFGLYCFHKNGSERNAVFLIKNAKSCGTVAIKLLQFICMRNSIKNKQLSILFENCDTHTLEQTKQMYLQDFGKTLEHDFIINNTVVGSGSIGQVYRFYSKQHRGYVALKSKHPCIDKNINTFVLYIKVLSWFIRPFNIYHEIIREYLNNITQQLDYSQEVKNMKQFKLLWKDESCVIIPEVFYHSKNFICMSFHDGENFNELTDKQKMMASLYLNFIVLTSLLVHDFLHVDLHLGNWKVNLNGFKIVIYDCGIMCKTGDLQINKEIILLFLAGRYEKLVYVICNGNQEKLDKTSRFIKNNLPK
jgi:predicted unusual protein kinase regulating ubiquinone biosynthesis (AarF/ABC1/UbiB family)